MGLTPSGGLLMGTRSGDLDPGVLTYLMRERQYGPQKLDELVNHRSGLLGISGSSSDLRALREATPGDPRARLAVQMFCQSVARGIAGMIAMLDGVDMLVFTGGIGENDAATRADVCASLGWMGIRIDPDLRTMPPAGAVQAQDSRCEIRVLPSRENEQMARHALAVFNQVSPRRHETSGT
jgi:acetate kinase